MAAVKITTSYHLDMSSRNSLAPGLMRKCPPYSSSPARLDCLDLFVRLPGSPILETLFPGV